MSKRYLNEAMLRVIGAGERSPEDAKSAKHPGLPVFEIVDQDLRRVLPPESDQEAYERNERIGLAAWAEVERLRRIVSRPLGKPVPVEDEAVRMRRVIEAMRPIVEAAQEWNAVYQTKEASRERGLRLALSDALGANRERLGLAMSAWENSQTLSEDERRDAVIKAATAYIDELNPVSGWDNLDRLRSAVVALTANAGRVP